MAASPQPSPAAPIRIDFASGGGPVELAARLDLPSGEPLAYALLVHGVTCSMDLAITRRIAEGLAGEGIAVDADGNVYAAEGPNSLTQAGGAFTKYSVK